MTAIELVTDRITKSPIDDNIGLAVQNVAYESGAMIRIAGPNIIPAPPLILAEDDVNTILSAIAAGISAL